MLGTKYHVFHQLETSNYIVRTMNYSLPTVLMPHITLVTPTTYFGNMRDMRATSFMKPAASVMTDLQAIAQQAEIQLEALTTIPSSCSETITPSCLRALYNSTNYVPTATETNVMGVAGYLEQFANYADLQVWLLTRFRGHMTNLTQYLRCFSRNSDQMLRVLILASPW